MKNYFQVDGHLTDQALNDLISGCPDELARLEISEHLSFCDSCTERYVELLSGAILTAPPEPTAPAVLQRIKRQTKILFLNRYARVGIAASLTLLLWLGGAFTFGGPEQTGLGAKENLFSISQTFSEKTADISRQVTNGINQFIDSFTLKGVFEHEEKK